MEYQAAILFQISVFYDLGASCYEVTEVFSFQHAVCEKREVCYLLENLIS